MKSLSLSRLSLVLIASLFVLASCGSADGSASSAATTSPPTTSVPATTSEPATSAEVEAEAPDEATAAPVEETTTTLAERTEEEAAVDSLDLMMVQLGIRDLEGRADCVIERLESENIELTGEGTAELIALSACDETVIAEWLPSTNPALPTEAWACTVQSIGDWLGERSIPEAEAFLSAAQPPAEFIELTASNCGASAEDIAAAFS